ncbi:MAG: hypothetical protein WKF65_02085 [Gaiellaceae bacterium]
MTAQPSSQTRFRRAIDARSVLLAELTAREMRHLTLADALELVILYAEKRDRKFDRAACRWLSRLTVEQENLTLAEAQLAAAALGAVELHPQAGEILRLLLG